MSYDRQAVDDWMRRSADTLDEDGVDGEPDGPVLKRAAARRRARDAEQKKS